MKDLRETVLCCKNCFSETVHTINNSKNGVFATCPICGEMWEYSR